MSKKFKIIGLIVSTVISLLLSCFVVSNEAINFDIVENEIVASKVANRLGLPIKWLTLYSKEPSKNVLDLLSNNEGFFISVTGLALNIVLIYFLIYIIRKTYDTIKYYSDKERDKNAVVTKDIWKNDSTSILQGSIIVEILLSTFVVKCESVAQPIEQFANKIGLPFNWLEIYSNDANRSFISLIFNNNGTDVNLLYLMIDIAIIYGVIWLIIKLYKLIKRRRSPDYIVVEKQGKQ